MHVTRCPLEQESRCVTKISRRCFWNKGNIHLSMRSQCSISSRNNNSNSGSSLPTSKRNFLPVSKNNQLFLRVTPDTEATGTGRTRLLLASVPCCYVL